MGRAVNIRTRRIVRRIASSVTILAVAVLSLAPAARVQAATILCSGSSYSTCINAGYSDHGYEANNGIAWWNAFTGHNCTNYAAYMAIRNGAPDNLGPMDDASHWKVNAANKGYAVDNTPAAGAIAWWDATAGMPNGHVAYVEFIGGNGSIRVSEDNFAGPFQYRDIAPGDSAWPQKFIHFSDIPTQPPTPSDNDGDGIPNNQDGCPNAAGPAYHNGCPINQAATGYVPTALTFDSGKVVPIVGDWDDNGRSDFGTVNGSTWTLRFSNGSTWSTTFGNGIQAGDIPIVGDWDGNGKSDLGIVRGNQWILRFANGSTWSTTFGNGLSNGDVPIVGDWDHDGKTDFGVVRGSQWIIRFANGSTWSTTFGNGLAQGDIPITGDWDNNGNTDFGIVRGNQWIVRFPSGATWSTTFGNGITANDIPIVGDWDDNGRFDFGVANSGTWVIRFSDASTWTLTTFGGTNIQAHL
jgi:surface antigen